MGDEKTSLNKLTTADPQNSRSEFTPSITTDSLQLTTTQEENPETESSGTAASVTPTFIDEQNTLNERKGEKLSFIARKVNSHNSPFFVNTQL